MCSTGFITPENKGGVSDPLWKISISKPLFFNMASLTLLTFYSQYFLLNAINTMFVNIIPWPTYLAHVTPGTMGQDGQD